MGSRDRPAGRAIARPLLIEPPAPPYRTHEIHPRVFTPRQCDRIVALGTELVSAEALLEGGDGDEVHDVELRRSRTAWIAPDDNTWWIFEKLASLVEKVNRRYGFELTGFGEDLQFTTYDGPGSFYSWHQDGLDGEVATRKLSFVVQLSAEDDYDGGELQLFDVVEDYDREELAAFTELTRERGTVVAFPSFEYHRVLPMRRGCRHSLVAWVSGPPFR
ncbi:MAG TPA: 2OG-Fe(II) oxygenase [Microthrixaceae bacterium]|nr:2OG-Fe(II) oxygenase [Microthrixaceae bacterium]